MQKALRWHQLGMIDKSEWRVFLEKMKYDNEKAQGLLRIDSERLGQALGSVFEFHQSYWATDIKDLFLHLRHA